MFMVAFAILPLWPRENAKGQSEAQVWFPTPCSAPPAGSRSASSRLQRLAQTNCLPGVLSRFGSGLLFVFCAGKGWRVQAARWASSSSGLLALIRPVSAAGEGSDLALAGISPAWEGQNWMSGLFAHWKQKVNGPGSVREWFLIPLPPRRG